MAVRRIARKRSQFYRWVRSGIWQTVLAALQQEADAQGQLDWSAHFVDGTSIRVDGHAQPLQELHLYRHSTPFEQVYSLVEPSFCVVAQGSKEFLLGENRYRYDPLHYLLSTVDLPSVGQVIEASRQRPFLSLRLELPPTLVWSR